MTYVTSGAEFELPRGTSVSVATIASVAAALLVYVSGSFVVTQLIGLKRPLEALLIVPLAFASSYYWITQPRRLVDGLVGFVLLKTVVEAALRHEWIWILDDLATLLALTVILCAPPRSVELGARAVVAVAALFAAMGVVQWITLFLFPHLDMYALRVSDDDRLMNTVEHPIAVLGLFSEERYTLFGSAVPRLQSFAKEPSLNVLYFLLPACIGFILRSPAAVLASFGLVCFCVLSLSGSIFLSLGFAVIWWLILRIVSLRVAFLWGLPASMMLYLYVLRAFGLEPLFNAISFIARYGDFLNKGESLANRANSASVTFESALSQPFGSLTHPDLPGPWLINSSLEAGWLAVLLLIVFLAKLARQIEILNRRSTRFSSTRCGILLLLGTMATVVVFNDYQMSNYAGLILLGFTYRLAVLRNEHSEAT
jgi:hypothetical protein